MSLGVPGLIARQGEGETVQPLTKMENFRSSAREFLHRLDLLEKGQTEVRHTFTHMAIVQSESSMVNVNVCLWSSLGR